MTAAHRPLKLPEGPPSEQVIGKTLWNIEQAERAGIRWDFYTIGYSQKTIGQFIRILRVRDIWTLVDVRHDPVSKYKPVFSKDRLRSVLEEQAIAYIHMPDLGVPQEVRARFALLGNWDGLFEWYDNNLVPHLRSGAVKQLLDTATSPVAFMCVEQNPRQCHRHRLALALYAMGLNGVDL